jgi:hypothetical protein
LLALAGWHLWQALRSADLRATARRIQEFYPALGQRLECGLDLFARQAPAPHLTSGFPAGFEKKVMHRGSHAQPKPFMIRR